MPSMPSCTVCNSVTLKTVIHFGLQPPSNRFVHNNLSDNERHHLALGYCQECGTTQLTERMPIESVQPRFPWLIYNEPESHLDEVVKQLTQLPGISKTSRILGVTYKDQSTIARLTELGFCNNDYISANHFPSNEKNIGLETIQQLLIEPEIVANIRAKYGQADILLMRHVIEHSTQAALLIKSLRQLITTNGYLVMELPDSERIFKTGNHAFIWEEHISYFTEQSLSALANTVDADITWFARYPYPYEDSLVVAFNFSSPTQTSNKPADLIWAEKNLPAFAHSLLAAKQNWRHKLSQYRHTGKKIAIFGAGHLAVKFINFLDLNDLIDYVIDDHPHKIGMKMPGSEIEVITSSELIPRKIAVCISTLSPESEIKVRHKLQDYFQQGGVMIPAFNFMAENNVDPTH